MGLEPILPLRPSPDGRAFEPAPLEDESPFTMLRLEEIGRRRRVGHAPPRVDVGRTPIAVAPGWPDVVRARPPRKGLARRALERAAFALLRRFVHRGRRSVFRWRRRLSHALLVGVLIPRLEAEVLPPPPADAPGFVSLPPTLVEWGADVEEHLRASFGASHVGGVPRVVVLEAGEERKARRRRRRERPPFPVQPILPPPRPGDSARSVVPTDLSNWPKRSVR